MENLMAKKRQSETTLPELPHEIVLLAEKEHFVGSDLLAEAGRRVMAQHTKKLYGHLPGVLSGDDPHDIHQMRVATRRLRASLQATATAYRPELVISLRRQLRRLARVLGEVRDRDVLLMRFRKDAKKLARKMLPASETEQPALVQDELQAVIERLQDEREAAHGELVEELGRKRTVRLLNELNQFLTYPLQDVQADDGGLPLLVHHHAGSALWREYESVRRFETIMQDASSEQLHDLRIACKYLRYTLELFESALGEDAHGLLKQVVAMQEHLGNVHDTDVALEYLEAQHPPLSQPTSANRANGATAETPDVEQPSRIVQYIDMRRGERDELIASVQPLWQQLVDQNTRATLGRVISSL
jgi:CHAD domain-containing protein